MCVCVCSCLYISYFSASVGMSQCLSCCFAPTSRPSLLLLLLWWWWWCFAVVVGIEASALFIGWHRHNYYDLPFVDTVLL